MFSPLIVESDEFLSMPVSSQALYFHLGMGADDDGFIQPRVTMKAIGSSDDDLKVLIAKRFLLTFESGVVVVKHWLIHNLIQKDRYHDTRFQEEKKSLILKENKAYTEASQSVNKMLTQVRLGKVRLSSPKTEGIHIEEENKKDKKITPEMQSVFDLFVDNPARWIWGTRVMERKSAAILHREFGIEALRSRYSITRKYRNNDLCPQIDSPTDFLEKMPKMEKFLNDLRI